MIYIKTYDAPNINKDEILRYAGAKKGDAYLEKVLDSALDEALKVLSYKVCYVKAKVEKEGNFIKLLNIKTDSSDLFKYLEKSNEAVLFSATVGIELDRLISKYSNISPLKALLFQAIGAERIEALCDEFSKEMNKEGFKKARFSPGYGDFPLETQKDIFILLDCPRKIGLTLNESLIMSPTKSVTAIIGN